MLKPITCLLLLWGALLLPGSVPLWGQCAGLEVPNNGIDEDCDGLDELYLHLPTDIYLAVGQPFELFFRNAILSTHPADYVFEIDSPLPGTATDDRWSFTPTDATVGTFTLVLSVRTPQGLELASASTTVHVSPAGMPSNAAPKRLLMLGHSFFDQGYLPYFFRELLTENPNPAVSFHGKRTNWIDTTIRFQAIGGASWEYYANTGQSPMYHNGALDVRHYFDEVIGPGQNPDWLIIHLDVNDFCFIAPLDGSSLAQIDDYIDMVHVTRTRKLIDSLRATAPDMKIGITTTPPPSAFASTFEAGFGAGSPLADPWRWRKIISRLLFKNTEYFGNHQTENIYLLPTNLDLNDSTDFTLNDPVHPHPVPGDLTGPSGYRRMARQYYGWLRFLMHDEGQIPTTTPPLPATPAADLVIYPNPASEALQIRPFSALEGPAEITILGTLGQIIQREALFFRGTSPVSVRLAQAPPGLYQVHIRRSDGRVTAQPLLRH